MMMLSVLFANVNILLFQNAVLFFLSLVIVLVAGVVYVKNNVYICTSCVINICNS